MLKNWFHRLSQIASSTFGSSKEDGLTLEASLTKFERFFHFWVLVCRSFVRNRCPVRASALSYTTLIAMIPMLAVVMGITSALLKSQGEASLKQFIEQFVDHIVPSAPAQFDVTSESGMLWDDTYETGGLARLESITSEASNKFEAIQMDAAAMRARLADTNNPADSGAVQFIISTNTAQPLLRGNAPIASNQVATATVTGAAEVKKNLSREAANAIYGFAQKSYSGTLGVTGVFFLVLTAILTLTRVEETFNDIWGVTRGRDWWSRITNYTFTITFGPIFLIVALGLMSGPHLAQTRNLANMIPFLQPLLTSFLPVAIICFTFAMLYKLVPNTKVNFSAALVGGSLAGLAWNLYNHLGFLLASRWVSAHAVYGSLAMIPLLMGGLYIGWLTVLFGAQVSYAFQNRASYLQDRLVENVNQRGREFVALRLMTLIAQRFHRGLPPATIGQISIELGIPSKLVQQVMRTLLAAHLVIEVSGAEVGYAPARPLENINCHHILVALRATHGQEPATRDEPVRVEVLGEFARIQAAEEQAAAAVSLLTLVQRAQARLELAATPHSPQAINVSADVTSVDAPMFVSAAIAAAAPVDDPMQSQPKPESASPKSGPAGSVVPPSRAGNKDKIFPL